jgi:hypothetical protein
MRSPLWLALFVAAGIATGSVRASVPMRILFIGNSLTAANGLPRLVEALATAGGGGPIETTAVTANNFSLEDHWNSGPARRTILDGKWDVVVLQQGPSALPESQVLLREYVERFDGVIRKTGAKTALYMVWPSKPRYSDMDGVIASYTKAAKTVGGTLLPAGLAWQQALRRDPELPLYSDDQFHPSAVGSYLAALVIYEGLTGRTSGALPSAIRDRALTPARLSLLADVAHQAVTLRRR